MRGVSSPLKLPPLSNPGRSAAVLVLDAERLLDMPQEFERPFALEDAVRRILIGEPFPLESGLRLGELLRAFGADGVALSRAIAVPVLQKALQRRAQKSAQPALVLMGAAQRVIAQQFGQEIMQRILGVMMVQSAAADVAVERVMVLRAEIVECSLSHGIFAAAQA